MNIARPLELRKPLIVLAHALVVQALCWATMGIGRAVTSMETTLIIHLVGAPIFATVVSVFYFKRFNYTTPLQTATVFISVILFLDFFIVALIVEKSLEMFASPIGTWIPFTLIFAATYLTGLYVRERFWRVEK